MTSSPVVDFYQDRVVLVTGGSGFIGKVLVAKLLSSCPIRKIILLLRPKSGNSASERIKELLDNKAFEVIRDRDPNVLAKVEAVSGDLESPDLGLSSDDEQTLIKEVDLIFHAGASFDLDLGESLRQALESSVQGTDSVVKLASKMKNLKGFVHVSTITAHCDKLLIEEKEYSPPVNPMELLKKLPTMSDEELNKMAPSLLGSRPNGYSVSKAMAETIVASLTPRIPVAIVRPYIVGCAWDEPYPGWVDSPFGPATLVSAYGQGMLRVAHLDSNCVADIIPVDYLINLMIVSGWYLYSHKPQNCLVVNSSSQKRNPLTWGTFRKHLHRHVTTVEPYDNAIFYPYGLFIPSSKMHRIGDLLLHYLPAFAIDTVARLLKKKPKMLKIHSTLSAAGHALSYATTTTRQVDVMATESVWGHLNEMDRQLFPFDVTLLQWDQYVQRFAGGVRTFILEQSQQSLPRSRIRMKKLYYLHIGLHSVLAILLLGGLLLPLWIILLL